MSDPDQVETARTRRGLRKVKSLNLRKPEDLETVAQGVDELEALMKLKKILTNGDVFDPRMEMNHSERGAHLKNKMLLNAQARKSQRLPLVALEEAEEEAERTTKSIKEKMQKKASENGRIPAKKSSVTVSEAPAPITLASIKEKAEEWHDIDPNVKTEFWKEHTTAEGEYHHALAIKGWRESMEDTFDTKSTIATDVPNLFGVFDGHGGQSCAKYCETHLLQQIAKRSNLENNTSSVLTEAFLQLNAEYNKNKAEKMAQAGSTATVIFVKAIDVETANKRGNKVNGQKGQTETPNPRFNKKKKSTKSPIPGSMSANERIGAAIHKTASLSHNKTEYKFYCASAGDSRAVLVYSSGKTVPLSLDHNLRRKDELERIKQEEGEIRYDPEFNELLVYSEEAQRGLNVTRSIGDRDFEPMVTALPDVKEGFLTRDAAFFLIASDGLWAKVNNDEVGRILCDYGLEQGLRNLADLSNKREGYDNCTLLGVDIQKLLAKIEDSSRE